MSQETWLTRDRPLLETIVGLFDAGAQQVTPQALSERTGLSYDQLRPALRALAFEDPPFFHFKDHSGMSDVGTHVSLILDVTGHARRAVETWPTVESLADLLVVALQQAAEEAEDEEEASRLRRTSQWFGAAGRDVLVNIIASAMAGG